MGRASLSTAIKRGQVLGRKYNFRTETTEAQFLGAAEDFFATEVSPFLGYRLLFSTRTRRQIAPLRVQSCQPPEDYGAGENVLCNMRGISGVLVNYVVVEEPKEDRPDEWAIGFLLENPYVRYEDRRLDRLAGEWTVSIDSISLPHVNALCI